MDELIRIIERLRGPDGCPWDRAQSGATLAPCLIEEAHEAAAALAGPDAAAADEELGDVLFVTLSILAARSEAGGSTLDAVARQAAAKMRSRHPRLFGDPDDTRTWQELKGPSRHLASPALPALLRAQRVGDHAASRGFDWPDASGPRAKIDEELVELDETLDGAQIERIRDELGDLLFSTVNLARHVGVDAETALAASTAKFEDRFQRVSAALDARGQTVEATPDAALEELWQAVKESSA